ncbi:AAA family ATPase [Cellulomonas dongxiuzhuiae]|uniref:AAA family ATPase n=1 Tax=Cellulomonas dongxiuzhuiae TaxID=2819979 RepID=UPI0035577359
MLGVEVVLDFGLWSRDERSAMRQAAAAVGAAVEIRYLHLEPEEQRRRIDRGMPAEPDASWDMSDDELAKRPRSASSTSPHAAE